MQKFGFCEFASPEGALLAVKVLNGIQLHENELLVKVDAKTQSYLDQYAQGMAINQELEERVELHARRILADLIEMRNKLILRMPRAGRWLASSAHRHH